MHDELTEIDIKKMKEEIEQRIALRPHLKEQVKAARELGDLSENDEYRSAKREMNRNNSRIRYLENMIRTAVIISADSDDDKAGLFDKLTIYYPDDDETRVIRIVTTLRNDIFNDCISKESPVGKALLGKKAGQIVTVRVNDTYSYQIKLVSIEKGDDDASLPISEY